MSLRRRLRRAPAIRSRPVSVVQPLNPWDKWLIRGSHIAQFGLFLLTAGTIYFTVIPLYQKALLDEQIARSELELGRIQRELDAAYGKIRASAVGAYVFHAGAECSGLLLGTGETDGSAGETKGLWEMMLAIAPDECLSQALSLPTLEELKPQDLALFQTEVSRIGKKLEVARKGAREQFESAEARARSRPHSMPTTPAAKAIAEHILANESAEFRSSVLAQIAVDEERSKAAVEYGEMVRSEVSGLRRIDWPEGKSSDL